MKKIFIIAGEESGDNLGSKLMHQLKRKDHHLQFVGIGGSKMMKEGLESIFPMQELNLMGFMEVLPHASKLMKRIDQTVETIIAEKPDLLVTIDSPGFNCRVAKKLKQKNIDVKKLHYVAPTVWAYKPGRAKKWAKLFDHLLCILPWEPPYFEQEGLKTTFIGHPVFEDIHILSFEEKQALRADYNYLPEDKLIAILPGSRMGEIKMLLPTFIEASKKIYQQEPNVKFILMPTESMRGEVVKHDHQIPNCITISDHEEKRKLLQICEAAIVKSGTISLEVAALKAPAVICYKINPLSHWMIRKMIKIDYANLINISADKEVIRELIQDECTSDNIAAEMLKLIKSDAIRHGQIEEANFELAEMGMGSHEMPSERAAEVVMEMLSEK